MGFVENQTCVCVHYIACVGVCVCAVYTHSSREREGERERETHYVSYLNTQTRIRNNILFVAKILTTSAGCRLFWGMNSSLLKPSPPHFSSVSGITVAPTHMAGKSALVAAGKLLKGTRLRPKARVSSLTTFNHWVI